MSNVGFEFPLDSADGWHGFNDTGMEHFSGNPFEHLGREVPQNTIDAVAAPNDPARIEVRLLNVRTADLPGIAELRKTVERCLKGADDESEKAKLFFEKAKKLLAGRNVSVLQIADHNTTGVVGPCENGKPYFALMKAVGQSKKSGTATGSFGIGKFAPYTVSDLRTVFLTTVWRGPSGAMHHYAQGKSILMSHKDDDGRTRIGTGFWGRRKNCMPVEDAEGLPDWLRRGGRGEPLEQCVGTTLSIVGFAGGQNWQNALAANVAQNFFGAINGGRLTVEIQGSPAITRETLAQTLSDAAISASIKDQKGQPDRFENVQHYYRAIVDETEVVKVETEDLHLGLCELRILLGEKLPKRVAVLRNGMLITDELSGLKRFSSHKEFVAVLECRAEKGLALLRAMEPPRHDDFEVERLSPEKRRTGRIALKEITKWVRAMLDRHAKDPVSAVTSLDEMADYFADDDAEGQQRRSDENPRGNVIIRERSMKLKPRPTGHQPAPAVPGDEEGEGVDDGFGGAADDADRDAAQDARSRSGRENDPGDQDQTSHPGPNAGGTEAGGEAASPNHGRRTAHAGLPLENVRAVPLSPTRRRVAFTPAMSGRISVELQDSGADLNYRLDACGSSQGTIRNGRVEELQVTAGQRCTIEVEFGAPFIGTLRVVANAV